MSYSDSDVYSLINAAQRVINHGDAHVLLQQAIDNLRGKMAEVYLVNFEVSVPVLKGETEDVESLARRYLSEEAMCSDPQVSSIVKVTTAGDLKDIVPFSKDLHEDRTIGEILREK